MVERKRKNGVERGGRGGRKGRRREIDIEGLVDGEERERDGGKEVVKKRKKEGERMRKGKRLVQEL